MIWHHFKYATYLIGYTVILGWIAKTNWGITQELLYWDRLYAFIVYQCVVLVYPLWLIGVVGIIREWKMDAKWVGVVTLGTMSEGDSKFIRYDHRGRKL